MKVIVDTGKCQAYANCIVAAPDVFDVDEVSGKVSLLEAAPADDRLMAVAEAVRNCPTRAISVERQDP